MESIPDVDTKPSIHRPQSLSHQKEGSMWSIRGLINQRISKGKTPVAKTVVIKQLRLPLRKYSTKPRHIEQGEKKSCVKEEEENCVDN